MSKEQIAIVTSESYDKNGVEYLVAHFKSIHGNKYSNFVFEESKEEGGYLVFGENEGPQLTVVVEEEKAEEESFFSLKNL